VNDKETARIAALKYGATVKTYHVDVSDKEQVYATAAQVYSTL
jgi:hypothetical protein